MLPSNFYDSVLNCPVEGYMGVSHDVWFALYAEQITRKVPFLTVLLDHSAELPSSVVDELGTYTLFA